MNIPNSLSVLRIILIPIIIYTLLNYSKTAFFSLLLITGLTDFFDGYLARKLNQSTKVGLILDSIADKLLIISLFVVLILNYDIKIYLLFLMLTREIVVVLGRFFLFFFKIRSTESLTSIPVTLLGKMTTFFQLLTIIIIVFNFYPMYFIWLTIVLSILTGIQYFLNGYKFIKTEGQ